MAGVLFAASGCSENEWNDKLDGFDGDQPITVVKTIEYTLTDADYASIASDKSNKAFAETAGAANALAAVGSQHCFSAEAQAKDYVPALLSMSTFPYFTLSDGSAVKVTYNVSVDKPEAIARIAAASEYVISDYEYADAWGSEDNYIAAFTPAVPAAKNITNILSDRFDDAVAGDYVLVSYNYSDVEPVFGNVGGGGDEPGFVMSDVIGTLASGDMATINGVVTAKSTNGMIVTDNGGSIFAYYGNSFDYAAYNIGDQIVVNAEVGAYNKGLQLTGSTATVDVVGHEDYVYPAPKIYTGADLDAALARTDNEPAVYGQISGSVVVSGNNININVEGAETAKGGAYYAPDEFKNLLTDGAEVTMTGYFIAIAGGRYCNFVVTNVTKGLSKAPVAPVNSTNLYALFTFNGSRWSQATDVVVLQPSDYKDMQQNYTNLSGTLPATLLPIFMDTNYPYAQEGDTKYVMYKYYDGSSTTNRCDQYVRYADGWKANSYVETETSQFVKNAGKWNYDPSVTVTLPAGRNQELSTLYFQACVDWVFENICKPMGSTDIKSGQFYVTSYGNNEYYSGTSAYQGNVDLRASAARLQYADGYADMTDDEVVETEKRRFAYEVMPGALAKVHPDAVPVAGIDVLYTINFAAYTGSTSTYTIIYKVTAPATFEFVSCDWWEGGQPAE